MEWCRWLGDWLAYNPIYSIGFFRKRERNDGYGFLFYSIASYWNWFRNPTPQSTSDVFCLLLNAVHFYLIYFCDLNILSFFLSCWSTITFIYIYIYIYIYRKCWSTAMINKSEQILTTCMLPFNYCRSLYNRIMHFLVNSISLNNIHVRLWKL
jgi:hypothetical protein